MAKIEERVESMIEQLFQDEFELVDVEYVKEGRDYYLRVLADKREGKIVLDDCTFLSRKISEILDEKDPITDPYMLEVSSPGIDRALKKARDFEREKGKEVELKLFKSEDGQKEYEGILVGLSQEDNVLLDIGGNTKEFPRKNIAIIRLKINF